MESTIINKNISRFTAKFWENIIFLISLSCLILMATSAYTKIEDHERFIRGLSKVQVIGAYSGFIAWAVPLAEIIVSLFLIHPRTYRRGLYGFTGLMIVFTLYILSMLLWRETLPCHCNLIIEKLSWTAHLWFNIGCTSLAVFALWLIKQQQS